MKRILFVCRENTGRSQVAEAFFNLFNKRSDLKAFSAGLEKGEALNQIAVAVMKEAGVDLTKQKPKKLTIEMIREADLIITMGCIEACPATPPEKTVEWKIKDFKQAANIEEARRIRDEIKNRVVDLLNQL
ncbi:MAG: arsenate reductase ArsC [Candidatus Odinarchaeum yellowstonii]|uniref:Arsenate reductase ArsC n=1 Tax=Odinarchaeota yellowstonii (strain LCB_4) TaxID=1841599 RepID=A0AAF0IAZ7_ODILC|nr:MAG: arsenate reductase ArsC [Candidatus Odinarchaeum yellowstonii]